MRKDVIEGVKYYLMNDIKPNFAALARDYDCDPRTVKPAYERLKSGQEKTEKKAKKSILDPYKELIKGKLESHCSAKSIYWFIQKKGYSGRYSTVKQYCRKHKNEQVKKATIRVETSPGLSGQVDWQEEMTMYSRTGKKFNFNLFLFILGYSRLKFIKLTVDRKQDTLFECLAEAFDFIHGVPSEIWLDNMSTVVNREKSHFGKPILNERFHQFSKQAGFTPITCRPYRPQTKGKVEALARTAERLRVLNGEFETIEELEYMVNELCHDLNHELSQAVNAKPIDLWAKEKEYLDSYRPDFLVPFFQENISRIVSKESMIQFRNRKYSVPTHYIGKTVDIVVSNCGEQIQIYYKGKLIRSHYLSHQPFNYNDQDRFEILKSDVLAHKSDEEIESYIKTDLSRFDQVGFNHEY